MIRITDFDVAHIQSTAILASGWTLVLAGILSLPLPAPISTPALTIGGMLLTRNSRQFRQMVAAARRPFPAASAALTRRSARWPRALRYVVLRTDPRRFRAI